MTTPNRLRAWIASPLLRFVGIGSRWFQWPMGEAEQFARTVACRRKVGEMPADEWEDFNVIEEFDALIDEARKIAGQKS